MVGHENVNVVQCDSPSAGAIINLAWLLHIYTNTRVFLFDRSFFQILLNVCFHCLLYTYPNTLSIMFLCYQEICFLCHLLHISIGLKEANCRNFLVTTFSVTDPQELCFWTVEESDSLHFCFLFKVRIMPKLDLVSYHVS